MFSRISALSIAKRTLSIFMALSVISACQHKSKNDETSEDKGPSSNHSNSDHTDKESSPQSSGSNSDKGVDSQKPSEKIGWMWLGGLSTSDAQSGRWGSLGVASKDNVPGPRESSAAWTDEYHNFWLFGGDGCDAEGVCGSLNDVWRWDGTNWTWIAGNNLVNSRGSYGDLGVTSLQDNPGARSAHAYCSDGKGNLWIFGGNGYDAAGSWYELNDLWKWDGHAWTWLSGSKIVLQKGSYGQQGVPAADNVPGARSGASLWCDSLGNVWLFGGYGMDEQTMSGSLNDLWKWDGENWTWISGGKKRVSANYGAKGVASSANIPGSRHAAASWIDKENNLWLFGGYGTDKDDHSGKLNDLWKWDGEQWTWMAGPNTTNSPGHYGTIGVKSIDDFPSARSNSLTWRDADGKLWLMGGEQTITKNDGINVTTKTSGLNDLWVWDDTTWLWQGGSQSLGPTGNYGHLNIPAETNIPGGRNGSATWTDGSGNFWVFGGMGVAQDGTYGLLNDFWQYRQK